MEHAPIRLVAFDLDGTVLNSKKQITPRVRAALAAAAAKGAVLVPATGRPLGSLGGLLEQLPPLRYAMTSNGAALWDMGGDPMATVRCRRGDAQGTPEGELPQDAHCAVLDALAAGKALQVYHCLENYLPGNLRVFINGLSVGDADGYAWELAHSGLGFHARPGMTTVVNNMPDYIAAHADRVEKFCMFFSGPDALRRARIALEQIPDIEIVQGAPTNLEVTAPGVDKGSGLRAACRLLNIPIAHTLALGDSENDWGMLRVAGVAAAMANATPETKALAGYISAADCDHDGAAEILDKFC